MHNSTIPLSFLPSSGSLAGFETLLLVRCSCGRVTVGDWLAECSNSSCGESEGSKACDSVSCVDLLMPLPSVDAARLAHSCL